jgi:hypothetical protein
VDVKLIAKSKTKKHKILIFLSNYFHCLFSVIEINAMVPTAVVAVPLNVPAEGAGALAR